MVSYYYYCRNGHNGHGTLDLCSNQTLHRFRRSSEEVVVVPDLFITSTDSVICDDCYQQILCEKRRRKAKECEFKHIIQQLTDGIPTGATAY